MSAEDEFDAYFFKIGGIGPSIREELYPPRLSDKGFNDTHPHTEYCVVKDIANHIASELRYVPLQMELLHETPFTVRLFIQWFSGMLSISAHSGGVYFIYRINKTFLNNLEVESSDDCHRSGQASTDSTSAEFSHKISLCEPTSLAYTKQYAVKMVRTMLKHVIGYHQPLVRYNSSKIN